MTLQQDRKTHLTTEWVALLQRGVCGTVTLLLDGGRVVAPAAIVASIYGRKCTHENIDGYIGPSGFRRSARMSLIAWLLLQPRPSLGGVLLM